MNNFDQFYSSSNAALWQKTEQNLGLDDRATRAKAMSSRRRAAWGRRMYATPPGKCGRVDRSGKPAPSDRRDDAQYELHSRK